MRYSSIDKKDIISEGKVNQYWAVEFKVRAFSAGTGTLVCRPAEQPDGMETSQYLSLTFSNSTGYYWDDGVFTPRAK